MGLLGCEILCLVCILRCFCISGTVLISALLINVDHARLYKHHSQIRSMFPELLALESSFGEHVTCVSIMWNGDSPSHIGFPFRQIALAVHQRRVVLSTPTNCYSIDILSLGTRCHGVGSFCPARICARQKTLHHANFITSLHAIRMVILLSSFF